MLSHPSAHSHMPTLPVYSSLQPVGQKNRIKTCSSSTIKALGIVLMPLTRALCRRVRCTSFSAQEDLLFCKMKQAIDGTNQSAFIHLLLYDSVHPSSMAAALERDEWTLWRACLGSSCDLNANVGRVWKRWGSYYLHGWLWWTAHGVCCKYQSGGLHPCD